MKLTSDVFIRCNGCGNTLVINKNDIESETSSSERKMGVEIIHDFFGEYYCNVCNNILSFLISGYEYPVGAFNYENYRISGGSFIVNPELVISYYVGFDDEVIHHFLPVVHQNIMMILEDRNNVYELSPREFEEVVEEVFKQQGFKTVLTPQTRDGGRDIIASKSILGRPFVVIVECKRYNSTNRVGVEVVRGLFGVQTADRVNKSMIVTSSYFTDDAKEFANKLNTMIDLVDINELLNLNERL